MPAKPKVPTVDLNEIMEVHCKAYIPRSMDRAIKLFQASEIETTGENVTYSEAVRRLLVKGLEYGMGIKLIERKEDAG